MTENELYHHGILGMKWGVRRYQNKDGSLTPRGRKRLERLESEADQLRPKKKEEPPKSTAASKHPEIDEMDDDTLKAKNNRLNMEKQYDSFFPQKKEPPNPTTDAYKRSDADKLTDDELNERINRIKLEKQYKDLLPEDRSKGRIFVDDMLKPAIYNQGKKLTEDILSKGREVLGNYLGDKVKKGLESRLGISTDDIKKLGSQYKLDDMNKLSTKELEERNKRLKAEKEYKEYLDPNSKKKDSDGGKKDKKSDGEKTVKEEAQSSKKVETAQKKESKKQETSEQTKEPEKKVETNDYDVDKDKGYHREAATETGRDSDYGMVVYRRNPVVDVMSRWEEAAIANTVVPKKQEKKVEPILRTYSEEQADDFIKKFNKKRTLEAMKHSEDELYHHGIKGQKWGVRRYQNYDGTRTQAGYQRYQQAASKLNSVRSQYEVGKKTKADVKSAKREVRQAKKDVRFAKSADKGERLYNSGKKIRSSGTILRKYAISNFANSAVTGTLSGIAVGTGSAAFAGVTLPVILTGSAIAGGVTLTKAVVRSHRNTSVNAYLKYETESIKRGKQFVKG